MTASQAFIFNRVANRVIEEIGDTAEYIQLKPYACHVAKALEQYDLRPERLEALTLPELERLYKTMYTEGDRLYEESKKVRADLIYNNAETTAPANELLRESNGNRWARGIVSGYIQSRKERVI